MKNDWKYEEFEDGAIQYLGVTLETPKIKKITFTRKRTYIMEITMGDGTERKELHINRGHIIFSEELTTEHLTQIEKENNYFDEYADLTFEEKLRYYCKFIFPENIVTIDMININQNIIDKVKDFNFLGKIDLNLFSENP